MLISMVWRVTAGFVVAAGLLAGLPRARADDGLIWARQIGTRGDERWSKIATDAARNIYVGGDTGGSLDGVNQGGLDGLLIKYSPSGETVWIRQFGTAGDEKIYGVAVDKASNVIIDGYTTGSLAGTNKGNLDAFVAKYTSAGVLLWTRQILLSTPEWDIATGVATDAANNIFVGGYTEGSYVGANQGDRDVFLAKFSPSGSLRWKRQFGGSGLDAAYNVATDKLGNVFIGGFTYNALDGVNQGSSDAFVAKYDTNGTRMWIRQLGTRGVDGAYGVATDTNGNVVIGGRTDGPLDGAYHGKQDTFVAKYSTDGVLLWKRQLGTPLFERAYGVATDSRNNVLLIGHSQGVLGSMNYGGQDAFVAKYSADGLLLWTRQFGTTAQEEMYGVATDADDNILVGGLTFGSFVGLNQGSQDSLLVKFTP